MNVIRKIMEKMYIGRCNVIVYSQLTDPLTKKTFFSEQVLSAGNKCRLSHNSSPSASDGIVSNKTQGITLFLAPEVTVPSGSKIVVTQNNVTKAYKNSSEPKVYPDHQEIELEVFDKWA